jgi:hypothetical protein
LPGWAEARNVDTDDVWEHYTDSSKFKTGIGVGYCVPSRLIDQYINFVLKVE